jgi:tRNA pseudouridine32 synthase/23S rRNA pseudouridine746 synthase
MGWPIVGDSIYGTQTSLRSLRTKDSPRNSVSLGGPPLHLHAREVTVPISKNKPAVNVQAPVPAHMHELLTKCGWKDQ